jgi:hypothetical protein
LKGGTTPGRRQAAMIDKKWLKTVAISGCCLGFGGALVLLFLACGIEEMRRNCGK